MKLKKKISFTKSLNIVFSSLLFTLIIASGMIAYHQWIDIKKSCISFSKKYVSALENIINEKLTNSETSLKLITETICDHSEISSRRFNKWLSSQLYIMPNITGLNILDAHNHYTRIPMLSENNKFIKGFVPQSRPWYQMATSYSEQTSFTQPYNDYISTKRIVSVSLPFFESDELTNGVVAFDIDLSFVNQALSSIDPPMPGNNFILTDNGEQITDKVIMTNIKKNMQLLRQTIWKSGSFYNQEDDSYYFYKKMDNPSWVVFYKVTQQTMNSTMIEMNTKIYYFIMLSILIICFAWWAIISVMNTTLTNIASSIRYGRFDGEDSSKILAFEIENNISRLEDISSKAATDGLTRLLNRRAFDQQLETFSYKSDSCLALIDIDDFKAINDKFGHTKGDLVLKTIAKLARKYETEHIKFYRYGGEEIAALFDGININVANSIIEALRMDIAAMKYRESNLRTTVSGGVVSFDNKTGLEALEAVDKLLYLSKENGKNTITR